MDIVVCIKQVPETSDVGWDSTTGSLIREGVEGVLNPNDKNALEAALQIREHHGGEITALSMGPRQAEDALREALSMGVDTAILLNDRILAGSDTLSTSYALHSAIKKISHFDLILCGKESWDAMTAHVGPQLSELLNLPQLTYATEITIHNNSVRIKQKLEDGFRIVESPFPALITVEKEINQPRIPSMESIMNAYRDKEVHVWTHEDLGEDTTHFGLQGSPTQSRKVYIKKVQKGKVTMLEGKSDEIARNLIQLLKQKGLC
jgi:electron transfer flavoprotein alpha/beta subunit